MTTRPRTWPSPRAESLRNTRPEKARVTLPPEPPPPRAFDPKLDEAAFLDLEELYNAAIAEESKVRSAVLSAGGNLMDADKAWATRCAELNAEYFKARAARAIAGERAEAAAEIEKARAVVAQRKADAALAQKLGVEIYHPEYMPKVSVRPITSLTRDHRSHTSCAGRPRWNGQRRVKRGRSGSSDGRTAG